MGSLATVLVMALAILCSDWEKLAEEAKEELAQLEAGANEDGSESDLDGGSSSAGSPGTRAHEESVRLATLQGEHWLQAQKQSYRRLLAVYGSILMDCLLWLQGLDSGTERRRDTAGRCGVTRECK